MLNSASFESDDIEHTYKHPARGLTTDKATEELVACIREFIDTEKAHKYNLKKALRDNLLQQHSFVIIITIILLFIAYGLRADSGFSASHLIFEAAFLLILFCTNIFLDIRHKWLKYSEKVSRATAHLEYFEKNNDPIQVTGIHEPLVTVTHSTVLREGKWRDIPSTFLAKGDLVGLSEGDISPTRMECVEPGLEGLILEAGQTHTMEQLQLLNLDKNLGLTAVPEVPPTPTPHLKESRAHHQERCCFVVVEAPVLAQLSCAFQSSIRPTDPISYAVAFALKICVRILYFLLAMSIISIVIRAAVQENNDLVDLIIVRQTLLVLAMATILCSNPMLHIINSIANAKLMALFDLLQGQSATGHFSSSLDINNFDAEDQRRVVSSIPRGLFWKYFKILLLGVHPGLVHSVNLVNTLGSTTVFCCVDKDGVLSEPVWPVEEINLLQENIVSLELSPDYENEIPTIHFNDTGWRDYLPVLKPLGLNSLLNRTCCEPVPTTDVRNSTAQDSAKLRFIRAREKAHGVATQCVCQLGKKIGFADDAFDEFVRLKELHTIAPSGGQDVDHSPYMISLVVKDNSGTLQLLCKGSPDLITSHCSSYWDGEALRAFRAEEQQKINELYNKIIDKGGHCIAFAYKSIKPIYNILFEESNFNSPIVDVRVSPVHMISAASTNTEGYSPFLTPKVVREAEVDRTEADIEREGDGEANSSIDSRSIVDLRLSLDVTNEGLSKGSDEKGSDGDDKRAEELGDDDKREDGVGSSELRNIRDREYEEDSETYPSSSSSVIPPLSLAKDKRKWKGRRGKDKRTRDGEELQESSLRNSHIIRDDEEEEATNKEARKVRQKKSQTPLKFSVTDSADSSEREKDPRISRKSVNEVRRRKHHRSKGIQEDDEDGDGEDEKIKYSSEDVKKRTIRRKGKKRVEKDDQSSSPSTSEDDRRKKTPARVLKRNSSSSLSDSEEAEERARKSRTERKKRRAKKDGTSSGSSETTSSSDNENADDKRRRKHPRSIKKETSKENVRAKKKDAKKRDVRSPRKGKDDDSDGDRGKRKLSFGKEEDNPVKEADRKKSLQEVRAYKEATEDEVSCIESDAAETVTLDKLQADQIFIGMISMRELPKVHTNNFVEVLREAGVRFVLFSSEQRRYCNHFAHKLGLETDWNCCISLRDPGPNEPHVQDEPSKLPRGISSVRDHLEQVDNVPLLVPLFCDAGPAEKQEMIKILQENGEVVCCVGSALSSSNIGIFSQADISFALEPLLRRCHNRDRDTSDSRPLLTSRLMFEHLSKGPVSTHSLAIDMNSLPCSLVYHRHTDWNEILELLQLSRQMLTNVRHSLLYYAAGCIWLAFVVLLGVVFGLSLDHSVTSTVDGVPLTGLQVIWMTCIILPLFSISLITCPADPDIMHMLNGKNLAEYRLRGISKFSWYMAIRMAPSILLTTILFLWSVEVIWTSSNWGNVIGMDNDQVNNTNYGKALIVAQNVLMFASVYYLALTSASFHSHTTSIINFNPFRNVTWFICTILGIILQIVFFVISLAVADSFSAMAELPWYLYVVLFLWAGGLLFIDELMKRMYRKWFKRFQLELRLEFDTKLGMHSPI